MTLIQELTITDDVTGLFNARHLYTMLDEQVAQGQIFSLMFVDLDRFKSVNDTHGHLIGSRLLAEIGSLMKRSLGPHNAAFRYGGDEFVALLPGMGKSAASGTTMALREDLRGARFLEGAGLSLVVSGSFGLASYPEDGNTVPTILRAADTMMYEAKITRDSVAVAGKGTISKAAKSAADSGPRQAVAGLFLERDGVTVSKGSPSRS
jgi:diguanylate cyclase (GGDEF)-like protein